MEGRSRCPSTFAVLHPNTWDRSRNTRCRQDCTPASPVQSACQTLSSSLTYDARYLYAQKSRICPPKIITLMTPPVKMNAVQPKIHNTKDANDAYLTTLNLTVAIPYIATALDIRISGGHRTPSATASVKYAVTDGVKIERRSAIRPISADDDAHSHDGMLYLALISLVRKRLAAFCLSSLTTCGNSLLFSSAIVVFTYLIDLLVLLHFGSGCLPC